MTERQGIIEWDLGSIPTVVEGGDGARVVRGYPALLDDGDSVSLRVLTNPDVQQRAMRGGVRRLLLLTAAPPRREVERALDRSARLAIAGGSIPFDELVHDSIAAAIDRVLLDAGALPWDAEAFASLQREVRARAGALAGDTVRAAADAVGAAARVQRQLDRLVAPTLQRSVSDATAQLDRLVRAGFVRAVGTKRVEDVARFVRGIEYRLDRLADDVARDERRMAEVVPLERRYAAYLGRLGHGPVDADVVELGWSLEELRMSVFAQSLARRGAVSAKRIERELDRLGA
jgi:ATP-dependent helicase HrpA